jgi:dolichyl-phosphate beta-glucosyltransferase
MSVSIIIPAYNEEDRLPETLRATVAYFAARGEEFDLLVVDDGSQDGTVSVVSRFASAHPDVSVECLSYGGNRGKGYAVRYGMLRAQGQMRLFCDADLATPPGQYEVVLAGMRDKGAAIGIGSRPLRASNLMVHQPWHREMLGRGFNWAVRMLAVPGIADTQCGFKVFTSDAAQEVFSRCRLDSFASDSESLYVATRLGYVIAEVPIRWSHKEGSKVNMVRDGLRTLFDLMTVRRLHRTLRALQAAPAQPHLTPPF